VIERLKNHPVARAILIVVATAPIAVVIFAFVFMARSEIAFDESSCPFRERETRPISDGRSIREDVRICQDGVEEHRWTLVRRGRRSLELGRERLESRTYEGYAWSASDDAEGYASVELEVRGRGARHFRERLPDAGAPP
jgi:hypothetical protein